MGSPIRGRHFADIAEFWPLVYLGRFQEALETISRQTSLARQFGALREGRVGVCLAHMARAPEARALLREQLTKRGITAEEDEMFGTILADLLHAAVLVEDHDAAALLTKRLQGVTVVGWAGNSLTNVARPLGRAALLLGDRARRARITSARSRGRRRFGIGPRSP